MLSVWLLGDFCIKHDQALVTGVDTPRLQSLLAYLLLHREAPQSRAHLAFLFWPDTTETQARTNLRNLLHSLRHALPDGDSYLDATSQTLQWRPRAPFSLDVADLDAALARANLAERMGNAAAAGHALEEAVALYRGDLLPSCYDDWILPVRERLLQSYLDALERLARVQEEQRDYRAAIQSAQRLLRHDPLHEATHRQIMRLHALDGDRAGALRAYHTCATALQRELEAEPSAATQEAYQQVLGASPSLSPQPAGALPALVGREREWAEMLHAWRAAAAGAGPRAVIVSGEAGIGKTRLAEELLQWATRQGIACASARCYAAEGQLAFGPVAAWLRAHPLPPLEGVWLAEVSRLLPEMQASPPDLPRPLALTEARQRERLFEALARAVLGAGRPLLLTIDDLQWCDRDTLEWLHYLLRFDCGARLLVAGTYRTEEIEEGHPLELLLQSLRLHGNLTEVELGPLDEAATLTLAMRVAGGEIEPEIAGLLYRETEGNPLFIVETVRTGLPLRGQGTSGPAPDSAPDSQPGGASLSPKVRSVLEARLAQLTPSARELAELAATIGREFQFRVVAAASGRDEGPLVRDLDELWRRRIVRERGADAYDFAHDKLREVAYWSMSAARRRLLHRRAAGALESLHEGDPDAVSHQVAAHYERAGLPGQAAPYCLRAAQVARRVYANEEAIALLRRGLGLVVDATPGVEGDERGRGLAARLWEELGDLLELRADHEEALPAYRDAQARLLPADRIGQARLHRKVGAVLREQRLYADALDACRRAETALGEPSSEDAGAWWAEWIEVQVDKVWAHYWLAQWPEMEELVGKIRPVVQERAGAASRGLFLRASGLMAMRKHRYRVSDEMLADAREALAASRECGGPKGTTDCEFMAGFLHLWRRQLNEAEEHLQAALELAKTCGDAWLRTLSLTYLAVLRRFQDREDEVLSYARRAGEAAEAAHMPDYVAAAAANRAWLAWRGRDLPVAEQRGREALRIWRESPLVYPFQWQALWPLVGLELARGRDEEAWAHARALLDPKQQLLPEELEAALEAAFQARAADQLGRARRHLDCAAEVARQMGYL